MNIILCGLPACGKTTIGQLLAGKLAWNFIDTDSLIENAYAANTGTAKTCSQIFLQEGELSFRILERHQIMSLQGVTQTIIAVGGGSLILPENVKTLTLIGCLIYLKASLAAVWERMSNRGIPAYLDPSNPEKAFYESAEKRIPLYEKAAKVIIDTTNLNKQEIAAEIWQVIHLELFSKSQHGASPTAKLSAL